MIGMLIRMPKTTSAMLPLAAPATAITLSRLMTASATMMVLIAPISVLLPATLACPSSSSAVSSLTPIHSSSSAPTTFSNGSASNCSAKNISTTRNPIAPATPQKMPLRRCSSGSLRQASAITTALSPPSRMSIRMIWPTDSQNVGSNKNSGICHPSHAEHGRRPQASRAAEDRGTRKASPPSIRTAGVHHGPGASDASLRGLAGAGIDPLPRVLTPERPALAPTHEGPADRRAARGAALILRVITARSSGAVAR